MSLLRTIILIACASVTASQAAQRTFVASYGSDANVASSCNLSNPCRSFAAALGVTDTSGEVAALDAAGYGPVTITSSVTITSNPGFYAGIAAFSGNAVTIASPGVQVTLRGLNLNGQGASYGVHMTNGNQLTIENCVISNFNSGGNGAAVYVNPASGNSSHIRISDSDIRYNWDGVVVQGNARVDVYRTKFTANQTGVYVSGVVDGSTARASVTDSIAAGNFYGFKAQAQSSSGNAFLSITRSTASGGSIGIASMKTTGGAVSVIVSHSLVTHNADTGLYNTNAILESEGNNTVRYNGQNSFGTISPIAAM